MGSKEKPYVLFAAELIYSEVSKIKKKDPSISNIEAIKNFIGSPVYNKISSGEFHKSWLKKLEENNFIDKETKKKIPDGTIKLLSMQKDLMTKQLIQLRKKNKIKNFGQRKVALLQNY